MLKWPNDVLVDDAKVCGILAERVDGPQGPACVLGLGINVHLAADELPVPTATSLAVLRPGQRFVRAEIMATVLATLALLYHRWEDGLDAELAADYLARSGTIGRSVRVLTGDGTSVTGEAVGVDAEGRLRVRTPTGVQTFAAGDVTASALTTVNPQGLNPWPGSDRGLPGSVCGPTPGLPRCVSMERWGCRPSCWVQTSAC